MKKFILLLTIVIYSSCSPSMRLVGQYNIVPYSIDTNKSVETIWNNIVDWFFETQTPISLIDKDSGIITSSKIPLLDNTTYEINGQPDITTNYIVIPNGAMNYTDIRVHGRIMARVKLENGKTRISVFLGDIECMRGQSYIEAKSIGTFEKNWLKYISNK